jgi:lysophospholipase L1-like esterase
MTRLLIRGGSIAAGYNVEIGYADILRDWGAARGIELINCSRSGENTFDAVRTFDEEIAPLAPDLLIIHFGLDDAFGCVYKSEFKENLVQLVRRSRGLFHPIIIMPTSQPFESPSYMQPAYFYYQIIRDVCGDLGCEMVPVHTYWSGLIMERGLRPADLVQENVLYPNERGHDFFAQALIQRLERILSGSESEARRHGC